MLLNLNNDFFYVVLIVVVNPKSIFSYLIDDIVKIDNELPTKSVLSNQLYINNKIFIYYVTKHCYNENEVL
jgi:hypothetical protein